MAVNVMDCHIPLRYFCYHFMLSATKTIVQKRLHRVIAQHVAPIHCNAH